VAGLAAEVAGTAAPAAQAALLLSRVLARSSPREPGEPARAPFLTHGVTRGAIRRAQHAASGAQGR